MGMEELSLVLLLCLIGYALFRLFQEQKVRHTHLGVLLTKIGLILVIPVCLTLFLLSNRLNLTERPRTRQLVERADNDAIRKYGPLVQSI